MNCYFKIAKSSLCAARLCILFLFLFLFFLSICGLSSYRNRSFEFTCISVTKLLLDFIYYVKLERNFNQINIILEALVWIFLIISSLDFQLTSVTLANVIAFSSIHFYL